MNDKFQKLVSLFRMLPGVGPRQAARFVLALLDKPQEELQSLGTAIANLRKDISFCPECFNVSENGLCSLCRDTKRDRTKLLVVEKVTDLESIEKTGLYKGLYHVLGGAINPLDNVTPDKLNIKQLQARIATLAKTKKVELVIATNPNAAGDTTALYLKDAFKDKKGVTLTHLARGLSSGSNLEYADENTLKHALEQRR